MPSIRSGFGSDFVLKSEKIGIGSETPTNTLDIGGAIKGNLSIAGVATLTSYGGFVAQNQHINKASTIGFGTVGLQTGVGIITSVQYYETEIGFTDLGGVHHGDDQYYNTLSEDLVIDEGQILNITNIDMVGFTTIGEYDPHSHQSHVCLGALEEVSVTNHFSVPCGGSNDRKDNPIEGTVRFSDDLNTLEFFNGNEWKQFTYNQGQSGRAVIGGGNHVTDFTADISYFSTVTQGNGITFGDLTQARRGLAAISSEIRGIWGGGRSPTERDTMDYVTIASAGNAIDFGNRIAAEYSMGGLSSSTRGIIFGGAPASDDIHYTTIATLGNEIDFGSLSVGRSYCSGFASPTRGVMGGGNPDYKSSMEYITIASVGNATDFGDLSQGRYGIQASSNTTRGVWMGGYHASPVGSANKIIDYNTIASTGNSTNFGDLSKTRYYGSGTSNQTRGFAITGYTQPSNAVDSSIEYVTINSAGNSVDFGDVSMAKYLSAGCSDSHGGLGGF